MVEAVGRTDQQLLDARHRLERGRPEIRAVGVYGHHAPAKKSLPLRFDRLHERSLAVRALLAVGWQEDVADAVLARLGKIDAQLLLGRATQQLIRKRGQHAGPIAGIGLRAARAAVVHVAENTVCVLDDLMGRHALDLGNEANATRVLLVRGVVETVFFGESVLHLHVGCRGLGLTLSKRGLSPFEKG